MKISLVCKDLLLEKALELFLKDHLVLKKDCDFLVCDRKISSTKPLFIISEHSPFLKVPFSKEALFEALREFDEALKLNAQRLADEQKKILEAKIDFLASEFKKDYETKIELAIKDLKDKLIKALMND